MTETISTPVDPRPSRLRTTVASALAVAALIAVAWIGVFVAQGGRWFIVETPSMGEEAPVGTLLWVSPVDPGDLHVGDFVTFRRPDSDQTFSHRIEAVNADGTITTKGAITATDPWRLPKSAVVGRVEMRWWGIGWVVDSLPILVLGGLAVWSAQRVCRRATWRQPMAVVGFAITLSVALIVTQPLTRAVQLSSGGDGSGRASYVSTGLLPLTLASTSGERVDLHSGQVGSVRSDKPDAHGHYPVTLSPELSWWMWALLFALCFVPPLWSGIARRVTRAPARHMAVV